jgi:hypothetical protein
MSETLDKLIDQLNYVVDRDLGIKKTAARRKKAGITEEDAIGGDRTDLTGGGTPVTLPADDEMENSLYSDKPVDELYNPNFGEDKDLEEERVQDVVATGETSIDTSVSGNPASSSEKAAALANKILRQMQQKRAAEGEAPAEEAPKEEEKICPKCEKPMSECECPPEEAKAAGYKDFYKMLKRGGAPFLRKCAALYDSNYKKAVDFYAGMHIADSCLEKEGANLADSVLGNLKKKASVDKEAMIKEAQICKNAYNLGASLAEKTIMKLAADLVAVQPVLQDLYAKGILTEQEKNALVSSLASAEVLTPDVINNAVAGLANQDAVAAALIKGLEGVVAENAPIPSSTNVIPTPEAMPGGNPTIDSTAPLMTTLDVTPEKAIEQKAQELLDAVNVAEQKKDENMVIQAALSIMKKRNGKRCK